MKRKKRKESKQGGTDVFEENHGKDTGEGLPKVFLHLEDFFFPSVYSS